MQPALARAVVAGRRDRDWAAGFPQEGALTVAELVVASRADAPTVWGPWEVRTVAGLLIGTAGFHGPPCEGEVEFGYGIAPGHRGLGLAGEAVAALVELARAAGAHRVVAQLEPGNSPSVRVLERAGFTRAPDVAPSARDGSAGDRDAGDGSAGDRGAGDGSGADDHGAVAVESPMLWRFERPLP